MFSGNIFGGTFNIDVIKQSMKKNSPPTKKALEDNTTPTVNKCIKLESKLQLKCFISLKICHLLECVNHGINCIDQGQGPLNMTADCREFPY